MGTKIILERPINPLVSSAYREVDFRCGVKFCLNDPKFGPLNSKKLIHDDPGSVSMDQFLEKQNAECIKRTMQAQEEIFKHQVRELHRVYSVQKMLMEEMKKELQHRQHWTNHHHLTLTSSTATAFAFNNNNNNPSPRERSSGSCSGEFTINAKPSSKGIDLERPAAADEDELELTLSIGLSSSSTSKSYQRETMKRDVDSSTASFKSENYMNNSNNNQECSGPSTPMSSSSTSLDQEKKKPHWLFQGLSINRTS